MARHHVGMTVISEVHKRTASAGSKFSAANTIRIHILIRPNSLKPPFGTPLIIIIIINIFVKCH